MTTEIPVATTTIPNPGGAAEEKTLSISYSWSQETNYQRQIKLAIPATSAGEKVPVVFHLHGNNFAGKTTTSLHSIFFYWRLPSKQSLKINLIQKYSFAGNGGQGNTRPFGNFLGDKCIIVAPDGYERSW